MVSCCCGFGKKEEPTEPINHEIIPSARSKLASPRFEEVSLNEIVITEPKEQPSNKCVGKKTKKGKQDCEEKTTEGKTSTEFALPVTTFNTTAIVEHVARGLVVALIVQDRVQPNTSFAIKVMTPFVNMMTVLSKSIFNIISEKF
ncbi:Oidioi.mRNA.OKI2018_I69.chr2.g7635.t1.cds [Oikopleura dioica]|uniref:Oidioi.mRNA.OKI2018_I69.chr2.g7635.t1.cds n=1 Tax=Oikopleura dioica TaxID=34765 RepID=A0ABN7TAA6_OIKDI|nr:Oidioi.mRNA.OKI2018_I69.chr2.g7635.t1.cds [Oikopleura dioica]